MCDQLQPIIVKYLVVINVVTFIVYGIDKWKARHAKWRIPEAVLLGLAFIGGSIGACMGMHVWHHKTLHKRFQYGVPLILLIQVAFILFVSCRCRQVAELSVAAEVHRYEPDRAVGCRTSGQCTMKGSRASDKIQPRSQWMRTGLKEDE